jgi:hypothetical protein
MLTQEEIIFAFSASKNLPEEAIDGQENQVLGI